MKRLVGVSNRTAAGGPKAGGLAVALWDALVDRKGLWFGWSGEVADIARRGVEIFDEEGVSFAVADLTHQEYDGYYLGYANRALWPVLHYRVDLANFDEDQYTCYRGVNRRFAKLLYQRLNPDDMVWIHDYHFFPMAQDLRDLSCTSLSLHRKSSNRSRIIRHSAKACAPTTFSASRRLATARISRNMPSVN